MPTATPLPTGTASWAGVATHYQLAPPLGGVEYVIVCDLSPLADVDIPQLPQWMEAHGEVRVAHGAEVFAVDATGAYEGEGLAALFQFSDISSHADVFGRFGYTITDPPPAPEPEEP
jgi:hypothetical protein